MELNDKVTQLEDEIKILKNEIQAVLLDLRESYLNNKNPFNVNESTACMQSVAGPIQAVGAVPEIEKEPVVNALNLNTVKPNELKAANTPNLEKTRTEPDIPVNTIDPLHSNEIDYDSPMDLSADFEPIKQMVPSGRIKKEWRMKTGSFDVFGSSRDDGDKSETIEISFITKLVKWVEASTKRIGLKRTINMLDIAGMMGYLSEELKDIVAKLAVSAPGNETNEANAKDYLAFWLELAMLLGRDNKPEIALFYMLCQEAENR